VLGLDLAVINDSLRFLVGEAELPGSDDLIRRLQGMMSNLEAKARQAEEQVRQAEEQVQQAEEQAEAARAQARAEAVLTVLRVRGVAVPDAARARILAERDEGRLERWLEKAAVAGSIAEVLAPEPG
jgi:membrane protein involved in colicin uptake